MAIRCALSWLLVAFLLANPAVLANGTLVGGNFPIANTPADSNQFLPAVAVNTSTNQCLVVWSDDRAVKVSGKDLYGRLVTFDGTPPTAAAFAVVNAPGDQTRPAVAYNSLRNEYLVVWEDDRNQASTGWDVYGQRLDANGALLSSPFIIAAAPGDQLRPAVAYSSLHNEYLVVWDDARSLAVSGLDVYGQRLDFNGDQIRLAGSNFPITTAAGHQSHPAIAYNSQRNEYLVVWQDERNAASGSHIYGQRLDADGARIASDFFVYLGPGDQANPAVAYNRMDNEYLVVWDDERDAVTGSHIYGQRLDASSVRAGSDFPISTANDNQFYPRVAYNGTVNAYLVVWADGRNLPGGGWLDIYGQNVAADGRLLWGNFPLAVAPGHKFVPVVAAGTGTRYLMAWEDLRSRNLHVYGQVYDTNKLQPPMRGSISGRVVRQSDGQPMAAATIRAAGPQSRSTITDSNGAYSITGLQPGTYTVTASAQGFQSATREDVDVRAGSITSVNFGLQTEPASSIIDHSQGFADPADLTANGSARFVDNVGRLTDGGFGQAGSFFSNNLVNVTSFTTTFTLNIHGGTTPQADGITFIIQRDRLRALGPGGGGLAYGPGQPDSPNRGIRNSVAVKFDLFNNAGEGDNSTGIFTDGRSPTVRRAGLDPSIPDRSVDLSGTPIDLRNRTEKWVELIYDGSTLTETITDLQSNESVTVSYPVDIPGWVGSNIAYVGFGGATGGLTAVQDILTWRYDGGED